MCVTPVGNFGKKTRYDISNRHEEEEPEGRERAEEREGCSQRVDGEREDVLDDMDPRGLKGARLLPAAPLRRSKGR